MPTSDYDERAALIRRRHADYDQWLEHWRQLGYLYEGNGPYLTGTALVPHPREVIYQTGTDGVETDVPLRETEKFKRRRQIAAYENLAQVVIDTITEHQYVRQPQRSITDTNSAGKEYVEWLEDVDGLGTSMDSWLEIHQTLANLYGHLFVVMDKLPDVLNRPARTKAEEGRLVLRSYIPPDVIDWLVGRNGELRSIKTVDAKYRESILEPEPIDDESPGGPSSTIFTSEGVRELEYRVWDENGWTLYNDDGIPKSQGRHSLNQVQAVVFYSRRRATVPILGRSILRNPGPFKDHFNLLSEFRELLRSNTFSMLSIKLDKGETVEEALTRLGSYASTETVLFSSGDAVYVAPPGGPAETYLKAIARAERQIYRLVNLPYEGDSHQSETADSRRIKALGLNRVLSRCADEAERFEYQIAKLWFMMQYGRQGGLRRLKESRLAIKHPDEFFAQQITETVDDVLKAMSVRLGPHANALLRRNVVPIALPNLSDADTEKIEKEIDELSEEEAMPPDPTVPGEPPPLPGESQVYARKGDVQPGQQQPKPGGRSAANQQTPGDRTARGPQSAARQPTRRGTQPKNRSE